MCVYTQMHFLPVWKVNAKLSSSSFCMVQPTNKSVIGSNLREDSIKKAGVCELQGSDEQWGGESCRVVPPSSVPRNVSAFTTFRCLFPPSPSPIIRSALQRISALYSTPKLQARRGSRTKASDYVFKIKSRLVDGDDDDEAPACLWNKCRSQPNHYYFYIIVLLSSFPIYSRTHNFPWRHNDPTLE